MSCRVEPEREVLEALRQRLRAASLNGGEPAQQTSSVRLGFCGKVTRQAIGFPDYSSTRVVGPGHAVPAGTTAT